MNKRTEVVKFLATKKELQMIQACAVLQKQTLSAFIRQTLNL
jgi:hypothetical protein